MRILLKDKFNPRGVAAIEFALIFHILFLMLYGLLTYSLIFAIQHTLSLAAAEGGRAAVRFISNNDLNNLQLRKNAACIAAGNALSWISKKTSSEVCKENLGNGLSVVVESKICPASNSASVKCIEVNVGYDYKNHPFIPVLLPVPNKLMGYSFTQFALSF